MTVPPGPRPAAWPCSATGSATSRSSNAIEGVSGDTSPDLASQQLALTLVVPIGAPLPASPGWKQPAGLWPVPPLTGSSASTSAPRFGQLRRVREHRVSREAKVRRSAQPSSTAV
jgi:hypothetical protein